MNVGQRAAKRAGSSTGMCLSGESICLSCRIARHASTAAAEAPQPQSQDPAIPPVTSTGPQRAFRVLASPLLSRPPLLTRELTSFEKAYYLYQKRLNERLALPFSRYFYYKKGTPADLEWKKKAKSRNTAARDIGLYNAYSKQGWNDEVLLGSDLSEPKNVVENLMRDAEGRDIMSAERAVKLETPGEAVEGAVQPGGVSEKESELHLDRPMPRETEADHGTDVRSMNRRLDRTLYLLVKRKDGNWRFPEDRIYGRENVREAAERTVFASMGPNLHHWLVANHPVAYYQQSFSSPITAKVPAHPAVAHSQDLELEEMGEKVFFMKGRVMAGQVDLKQNEYGDQDWACLVKEEVKERVEGSYWSAIKAALAER